MDIKWLDDKGISTVQGMEYTGGNEKYISALQRYFNGYEKNAKAVEEYFEAKDWENYTIKVHALKSNSKMIGATALGSAFEELELAGKNSNYALIEEKTKGVLDQYKELIEILRPIGEAVQVKASDEISAEQAKEIVRELLEALDDFDDEKSAELASKLSGYPFRLTQKEKLKQAAEAINDFMYDEAAELIKEISDTIE